MVAVHPPLNQFLPQERADALAGEGLFADDPDGMRSAWSAITAMWATTVDRARSLSPEQLEERVDEEWSFIETLRHLIFVTDAWVRAVVLELPSPHHRWGMAPDFVPDPRIFGLVANARPDLDAVLGVRLQRQADVAGVVATLTADELHRTCAPREGQFTVAGALQTVMFEEWAHHEYATRDLARLQAL